MTNDELPGGPVAAKTVPETDPALAAAVLELEAHAASLGWDGPARLFALVETAELVAHEPALAAALGLDEASADGSLTPVEQEEIEQQRPLEDVLDAIVWPERVAGCAAVVERLVLPPGADSDLPEDATEAQRFAREHPERQEVRIVAGVTRHGATYCTLRMRSHDDDQSVVGSPDLVPGLLTLLSATLEQDPQHETPHDPPHDPEQNPMED